MGAAIQQEASRATNKWVREHLSEMLRRRIGNTIDLNKTGGSSEPPFKCYIYRGDEGNQNVLPSTAVAKMLWAVTLRRMPGDRQCFGGMCHSCIRVIARQWQSRGAIILRGDGQ